MKTRISQELQCIGQLDTHLRFHMQCNKKLQLRSCVHMANTRAYTYPQGSQAGNSLTALSGENPCDMHINHRFRTNLDRYQGSPTLTVFKGAVYLVTVMPVSMYCIVSAHRTLLSAGSGSHFVLSPV